METLWRSNELLLPVPTDPWPCSNPTIETHAHTHRPSYDTRVPKPKVIYAVRKDVAARDQTETHT